MKALVLLSGGVDSSTCLALAKEKYGDNVLALSLRYGQKHSREIESARAIANYYHVQLLEMDLAPIFAHSNCSLLTGSKEEIPHQSYAEQLKTSAGQPVTTYVPFRNGLFLATAASLALEYECDVIYYGPHADDAAGNAYPDCSQEFNDAINRAIYLGSGQKVQLVAPFVDKNKKDIVAEGLRLGVPYHLTWSCYEGAAEPCHTCGTCRDREAAFVANGVVDPLLK
ncbi:MAG: 7-cyano-7-deazaguanine synthase QueC [Phascolarctobacterium sp.]|nr:7-cyano-7-deazaguanine synthase QueC [Phascolarctobacterium sp.]